MEKRKYRVLPSLTTSVLLSMLIGCSSAPTPVAVESLLAASASDIQGLQSINQLTTMLSQLKTNLQGKDPTVYAEDIAKVAILEDQIVAVSKQQLLTRLDGERLDSGVIPLAVLTRETNSLSQDNTLIPAAKLGGLFNLVDGERSKTNQLVSTEESKLAAATLDDQRISTLDSLYALTGAQSWLDQKQVILQQQRERLNFLVTEIESAQAEGVLDSSLQEKIAEAKRLASGDAQIIDKLISVDAGIYEQRFFAALAEGDADKAYDLFSAMSRSDDFDSYKQKLANTSQKMADYFVALADESVKDPNNLRQSYRWYTQARDIRDQFQVASPNRSGELALVEQLELQSAIADQQDTYGLALAYLYLAADVKTGRNDLRRKTELAEEKVLDEAQVKVSTTNFETNSGQVDYGSAISSAITQYLFEKIPNDVRIVERQQYEAIVREKTLGNTMADLSAVDMLITGSVLDAKVDTAEVKGKKTMRVVIGKESKPNPAYLAWLEKNKRDRDALTQPPETIEEDIEENISINLTRHRKLGTFSVSYRLVDANSGKILFPDSLKKDLEFTDESSEGVEMGSFVLPFKLADLPSDSEILDQLAKQVSEEIGGRLVSQLEKQEQQYMAQADSLARSNDCHAEVENLAKALVIMTEKNMTTEETRSRLTRRAILCE